MAKVAFISTMAAAPWGGSEELWAASAIEAAEQGHRVRAFVFDWSLSHSKVQKLVARGIEVVGRPLRLAPWTRRIRAKLERKSLYLGAQVAAFEPELLIVSTGTAAEIAFHGEAFQLITGRKCPSVLIVQHNQEGNVPGNVAARMREAFQACSLVAFVSERNWRTAERQIAARIDNAVVVQNPRNLMDESILRWPAETLPPRFATVARLECGAKGHDILFEALSSREWRDEPWELNLYGVGPDEEYLRQLAAHYEIDDRVQFCGHVSSVREIWERNQMLVLPSRSEGTPLSLIEAAILGRPAVVTDVGDSARWVTDGDTGFVADAPTANCIGRALDRAWLLRNEWATLGKSANAAARERIDPDPGRTLFNKALSSIEVAVC
jgi:L-malate glycosyltransferase